MSPTSEGRLSLDKPSQRFAGGPVFRWRRGRRVTNRLCHSGRVDHHCLASWGGTTSEKVRPEKSASNFAGLEANPPPVPILSRESWPPLANSRAPRWSQSAQSVLPNSTSAWAPSLFTAAYSVTYHGPPRSEIPSVLIRSLHGRPYGCC